jgi:hypothetical protein
VAQPVYRVIDSMVQLEEELAALRQVVPMEDVAPSWQRELGLTAALVVRRYVMYERQVSCSCDPEPRSSSMISSACGC